MPHKDLEFHVVPAGESAATEIFETFEEAAGRALTLAIARGQTVHLDVVLWSKGAARAYGGDDAVETYNEDPDASVFERFEIDAKSLGRIR